MRLFGPQFLEVFNATMLGWQISGLQWHLRKIEPHRRRLNRVNAGRRLVGGEVPMEAPLQEEQRKLEMDPGVATTRYDIYYYYFFLFLI